MQALKKELSLLVPSLRIFLDIENLTAINDLEALIDKSEVVLIFLSAGYFARWNCLREARQTLVAKKPTIFLREVAFMHGGGSMSLSMQEIDCPQNRILHNSFDEAYEIPGVADIKEALITNIEEHGLMLWHRIVSFKQATLKMIVSRMLHQQHQVRGHLVIAGELKLEDAKPPPLQEGEKFHICMSSHQLQSAAIKAQIMERVKPLPSRRQSFRAQSSFGLQETTKRPQQLVHIGVLGELGCTLQNSANFLLVLSTPALLNKDLMDEVRNALLLGISIITVHDKGTAAASSSFSRVICIHTTVANRVILLVYRSEHRNGRV
jgi:hypothetical protein